MNFCPAGGTPGLLEELRLAALEERVEADLALGRHAELVPELELLVRENPMRERLRRQLMLALYRSGRQAEALETYRDRRRVLDEELGLESSPELRELERAILAQDPAIAAPAPPRRLPVVRETPARRTTRGRGPGRGARPTFGPGEHAVGPDKRPNRPSHQERGAAGLEIEESLERPGRT